MGWRVGGTADGWWDCWGIGKMLRKGTSGWYVGVIHLPTLSLRLT